MYILDKTDRDFDQHERRDIHNVRCRSLRLKNPYAKRLGRMHYSNLFIDDFRGRETAPTFQDAVKIGTRF